MWRGWRASRGETVHQSFAKIALAMSAAVGLCGCGYKFGNVTDANVPVPAYWANRDYVDPSIAGLLNTSIDWFAGRIMYKDANNKYNFLPPVFTGTSPAMKVNTLQTSVSYQSAIDHNFSQTVTIPGLNFSPAVDVSYTYEITDISNVVVPDASVPTSAAVMAAIKPYNVPADAPVWWISVVELSAVRQQQGTKIGTGDTVTGTGFSINGTVMNSDTASSYVLLTSIATIPMNPAAQALAAAAPPSASPPPAPAPVPVAGAAPAPAAMVAMQVRVNPALLQSLPKWTRHLDHDPSGLVTGVAVERAPLPPAHNH